MSTFSSDSSKWMEWLDLFSEFIHMPKKWIMRNKEKEEVEEREWECLNKQLAVAAAATALSLSPSHPV